MKNPYITVINAIAKLLIITQFGSTPGVGSRVIPANIYIKPIKIPINQKKFCLKVKKIKMILELNQRLKIPKSFQLGF